MCVDHPVPTTYDSVCSCMRAPFRPVSTSSDAATDTAGVTRGQRLVEHDGLAAVHHDAVLEVAAQRRGEHALLEVAAFAHEIVDGIAMGTADRLLLDDRPLVEIRRHVVAGRADQ